MRLVLWMLPALVAALPALAGTTYRFDSRSTGLQTTTIAGTVSIDGANTRIDLREGDAMIFKSGSMIFSRDHGRVLTVFDPSTESFYELRPEQLASMSLALLGNGLVQRVRTDGIKKIVVCLPTSKRSARQQYDSACAHLFGISSRGDPWALVRQQALRRSFW